MARTYLDHLGIAAAHDGHGTLAWRVSIYVLAIRGDTILMVEPAWATRWELPGGAVELDSQETLLEGAVRECWEETGYRFTPGAEGPLLSTESFFYLRSHNRYCHSLVFTVRGAVEDQPDPSWRKDPDEIVTKAWVPLASLSEDSVYALHWEALRQLHVV